MDRRRQPSKNELPAEDMSISSSNHLLDDLLPVPSEASDTAAAEVDTVRVVPVLFNASISSCSKRHHHMISYYFKIR